MLKLLRNNGKLVQFPEGRGSGLPGFLYNENRDLANYSVSRKFQFTDVPVLRGFTVLCHFSIATKLSKGAAG